MPDTTSLESLLAELNLPKKRKGSAAKPAEPAAPPIVWQPAALVLLVNSRTCSNCGTESSWSEGFYLERTGPRGERNLTQALIASMFRHLPTKTHYRLHKPSEFCEHCWESATETSENVE